MTMYIRIDVHIENSISLFQDQIMYCHILLCGSVVSIIIYYNPLCTPTSKMNMNSSLTVNVNHTL